ncbi:MAG: single-stranded-DNA-specific exonuclease RecJ [Chitinophagaceae bacterium]
MQKRWNILPAYTSTAAHLHEVLKIHPTLCTILAQRGIINFETAKNYFRPSLEHLHSPWLMKDMHLAVNRIRKAFEQQEHILVFGDYDVDGTTSVASLYQFLKALHSAVDYYIPHRYKEGYGISKLGIDYAHEQGITLIISVDCGIKSVELIDYANSLGIDFIVCDHHLPDAILPKAKAILNPKQSDCTYPYKELCGCGVAFKLMQALAADFELPANSYLKYLDLVATAIAADIVPITGENRVLTYFGLQKVNNNPCAGIAALMKLAAIQQTMHVSNLVFVIAPRINAAGRMDDAKKAVQLFIEQDPTKALALAELLHSDNTDRKEADKSISEEALQMINSDVTLQQRKTTVVYQEHWHKGVVGIVASRLIEHYYRPTIVLTKSGDVVAGSARSVPGFNLYEAIHACREHLIGYGGHFAAAGMTLHPQEVANFSQKFETVVRNTITDELLIPEIVINAVLPFAAISEKFYNIIHQMEPFGPENMRPVFVTHRVKETGFSKVVKEQHLRFVLEHDGITFTGISFGMGHRGAELQPQQYYDIVYTLDLNDFKGTRSVQLKVIDFKPSASN